MDTKNILKEYEELTKEEQAKVDMLVEAYKTDTAGPSLYDIQCTDYDNDGNEYVTTRTVVDEKRVTGQDIENYMAQFTDRIGKVNEVLDKTDRAKNEQQNQMRMQLFEDRWKNGYYNKDNQPINQAPVTFNINNNDNADVKALKDEVSSLKSDINDLKQLFLEKLK